MTEFNTQPRPIISVAINPRNNSDHEKLQQALSVLVEEDPTLQIKTKSANE
jgi:translation elongation factor EF-G